ncbi:YT521-B-like domain-containing protein [Xylariales sp. AK1849]|nr:YT521-B-like domain-containing protein [Xylariales sp. AK1849]
MANRRDQADDSSPFDQVVQWETTSSSSAAFMDSDNLDYGSYADINFDEGYYEGNYEDNCYYDPILPEGASGIVVDDYSAGGEMAGAHGVGSTQGTINPALLTENSGDCDNHRKGDSLELTNSSTDPITHHSSNDSIQLSDHVNMNATPDTDINMAAAAAFDPDLQDWLTFTRWNDEKYRNEKLAYHRAAATLHQEELTIAAKKAQLRQFEQKYGSSPADHHADGAPGAAAGTIDSQHNRGLSTDRATQRSSSLQAHHTTPYHAPNKYGNPVLMKDGSRVITPEPHYSSPVTGFDSQDHARTTHRSGRARSRSPSTPTSFRTQPQALSRSSDKGITAYTKRREYRDHRGRVELPKKIDLGQTGETRYFVVRSFNLDNILACHEDGIWATKHENAATLTTAFETCQNVVLFFSANQSRAYQGYGLMKSAPSADNAKPSWYRAISWPISGTFEIEWILKKTIDDSHVRKLRNRLNDNLPPTRARDCQELDDICGRSMISILNRESQWTS